MSKPNRGGRRGGGSGGGSGAGSDATIMNDAQQNVVGAAGAPKGVDWVLQNTNPHYSEGREYRINCQRVVYAVEMARRGYDVEAQPNNGASFDWQNFFSGQEWERNLGNRNSAVHNTIEQTMADWGDGSRAIVYVKWKGINSAHVFNVERSGGKTIAYDGQTGKKFDIMDYLKDSSPSKTMISRVDNLTEVAIDPYQMRRAMKRR